MQDLGSLGGSSFASDINDVGQIVGRSYTPGNAALHSFLYSGGGMQDLGTLGGSLVNSEANAINNVGQIAGDSYDAASTTFHAYLYSGGSMQDISPASTRSRARRASTTPGKSSVCRMGTPSCTTAEQFRTSETSAVLVAPPPSTLRTRSSADRQSPPVAPPATHFRTATASCRTWALSAERSSTVPRWPSIAPARSLAIHRPRQGLRTRFCTATAPCST